MHLHRSAKWFTRCFYLLILATPTACAAATPAPTPTQAPISTIAPTVTAPFPTSTVPIPSPTSAPTMPAPTAAAPQATPVPVDFSQLQVIEQFEMIDANAGWAVTQDSILRTTDGGKTWGDVTPAALRGQGAPMNGSFVDTSHADLIAADPQNPDHGNFFATQDGGLTWTSAAAPFGMGWLRFLDPQTGFALASLEIGAGQNPVAIYHTADAGQTWTQLFTDDPQKTPEENGLPSGGIKNGLAFADAANGWVTGSEPVDGLVYLYRTQDGGKTWSLQAVPLAPGTEKAQFDTQPPRFFASANGVLVTQALLPGNSATPAYATLIYTTADTGAQWAPANKTLAYGPVAIASYTDWFIWNNAALEATHDGGKTWEEIHPQGLDGVKLPSRMVFSTPSDGWLISVETNHAALFHTTDGGKNWEKLTR
jgi:photosystem II stability/assembly factor-like uncharacterized protein